MQTKQIIKIIAVYTVTVIGFLIILCLYRHYKANIQRKDNSINEAQIVDITNYITEIPSTLQDADYSQGVGKGLFFSDKNGENLPYTEPLRINGKYLEGFITLVNAMEESDDVEILLFIDQEQMKFSVDEEDAELSYVVSMQKKSTIHIPIRINLDNISLAQGHKFWIVSNHEKCKVVNTDYYLQDFVIDMEYDLSIGESMMDEAPYIFSDVETADSEIKENYSMNTRIWINDSGSDESVYYVKKREFVKIEFWAYTKQSKIAYMNFLILDGKAIPLENEKAGIAWQANDSSMLHKTVELESPKDPGVYELYTLSLPISTNSFIDTFSSEKILLVVE